MGLPYICPYNVNSIMNPILVMCLGLGYFFNLYRGKPLVREGGVLIMSHPTPWEFHPVHHPSYIDFFEQVLAETTDPLEIEKKFEERFASDPWYIHLYRTSYAYHGVHPFYMWYWGAHALAAPRRRDHRRRRPQGGAAPGLQAGVDAARRAGDGRGRRRPRPVDHPPPQPAAAHGRRDVRLRVAPARSRYGRADVAGAASSRRRPSARTGVDYDTDWARRHAGPLAPRLLVVDGADARRSCSALASPDASTALDRLDGARRRRSIFAANHHSHLDTPLLLTSLPERWRHRTVVAAAADYFFANRVTRPRSRPGHRRRPHRADEGQPALGRPGRRR